MTESEILRDLKKNDYAPIYFLQGEEPFYMALASSEKGAYDNARDAVREANTAAAKTTDSKYRQTIIRAVLEIVPYANLQTWQDELQTQARRQKQIKTWEQDGEAGVVEYLAYQKLRIRDMALDMTTVDLASVHVLTENLENAECLRSMIVYAQKFPEDIYTLEATRIAFGICNKHAAGTDIYEYGLSYLWNVKKEAMHRAETGRLADEKFAREVFAIFKQQNQANLEKRD